MFVKYDKVTIGVVCENTKEIGKYFRLFALMLDGKITESMHNKHQSYIETDKFKIDFKPKIENIRGWRRHYILNLTQDKEFHDICVAPKTLIRDYLAADEQWDKLFGEEEIESNWSLKNQREMREKN